MKRVSLRIKTASLVLCTIVVLAQLLIGPAAALYGAGMVSERVAGTVENTVFLPTVVAAQVFSLFDRLARRYVAMWEPAVLVPASTGQYPDLR